MYVNMEFIIYLGFKCTYKLLKCVCVHPCLLSKCVYNVCFHCCNALELEQTHNVLGEQQTAARYYFFVLFAFFADKIIVFDSYTLITLLFFQRSLKLSVFSYYYCKKTAGLGVFVSVLELEHCHCLHVCCLELM